MSSRRVRRILAACLAVPLLITGCSPQQWGTAARIGDSRISVEEVQRITRAVLDSPQEEGMTPEQEEAARRQAQATVLHELIRQRIVLLAAARNGVTVTEAEVTEDLRNVRQDPAAARFYDRLTPEDAATLTRARLLQTKLVEKLEASGRSLGDVARRVADDEGVEVNPRYGTYDRERVALEPQIGAGLSDTTARPAPAEPDLVPQQQ